MKVSYVIYADTNSLLEKNIHVITFTSFEKIVYWKNKHTACSYSLFIHCLFVSKKSKHDFYKGKISMKKFSVSHATEIVNLATDKEK